MALKTSRRNFRDQEGVNCTIQVSLCKSERGKTASCISLSQTSRALLTRQLISRNPSCRSRIESGMTNSRLARDLRPASSGHLDSCCSLSRIPCGTGMTRLGYLIAGVILASLSIPSIKLDFFRQRSYIPTSKIHRVNGGQNGRGIHNEDVLKRAGRYS